MKIQQGMFEKFKECHKKMHILACVAAAFVIILSLFFVFKIRNVAREYSYIGRAPLSQYTINISGDGKVSGVPDIAVLNLGVTSEATAVNSAQDSNTKKMNAIIKAVKDMSVDEKDIQTTNYSIYPKYSYDKEKGISNIVGFTVSQSVTVKVRKLDDVGSILAQAGNLGANQVGGIQFTIDNPDSLKEQARQKAIKDAKDKANTLAKELGVSLGRVVSFNEYSAGDAIYAKAYSEGYGIGGGGATPDIQTGSLDVLVNVNIVFELK